MKIVVSRPVRRQHEEGGKVKTWIENEDVEFILPKECNKILKPVFSDLYYDFNVKEENGTIPFVLIPHTDINQNKE